MNLSLRMTQESIFKHCRSLYRTPCRGRAWPLTSDELHPLAKACKIETGLHTKPYEIQKTRSEIDFACAFSALRIWQTRRFLRSSRKKCCLFDGIIRDIFLHTWSSPVILREFIYIGGFPKYFILYRVTEKQRFVQIYECYLLFENAEKSKFTFFYRTFSMFVVSREKFNIDSSSCTHHRFILYLEYPIARSLFCLVLLFILSFIDLHTHRRNVMKKIGRIHSFGNIAN